MKGFGRVGVASTASALAVCLAGPASADQPAASKVKLKVAGGPPFHGRVISESPACIANRKVVLLEVAPDRGPNDLGAVCRSALSPAKRITRGSSAAKRVGSG